MFRCDAKPVGISRPVVVETARQVRAGKRGATLAGPAVLFDRPGIHEPTGMDLVNEFGRLFSGVFLFPMAICFSFEPDLQKMSVLTWVVWLLVSCFQIQRAAAAGRIRPGFSGDRKPVGLSVLPPGTEDGFH